MNFPAAGHDVTVPAIPGAPATTAYAALPAGARRGVVVIHEIFGRMPEIDGVVDRFAAKGMAAVAPDLYADGFKPLCIAKSVRAIHTGKGAYIDQILAARDWLVSQGIPKSNIGVIGFCMGGGFALATGPGFAAVSTNYGDIPPAEVLKGIGPVVGCYGGKDKIFGPNAKKLGPRLAQVGVTPEVHFYQEAGHAFLTNGDHPIAAAFAKPVFTVEYNAAIAEDAWAKILDFFQRSLPEA